METLLAQHRRLKLDHCLPELTALVKEKRAFLDTARGNFLRFKTVVDAIPEYTPSFVDLASKAVTIGRKTDVPEEEYEPLYESLAQLCPWRKGPFNFFGIEIDSEWQSWMKWDRLEKHAGSFKGKRILDIGSSNGYYMFRAAAQDPLMVLGVEPQSSFYFQYLALQKFLKLSNVFCLPVPHDQLPQMDRYFDTVFCMGVLYHRKSPIDMLKDIGASLKPGGMLILENLIIDSRKNMCLFPQDRYAKMRNVFFIPDLLVMESWLLRAGFENIRCVDVTKTSFEEQRKTPWIQTETLKDFLDPEDCSKTVEGYPAPVRAIFMATAV
ncbi:MAG: tRNA 5-methoxyuridine(34)/uridine 5-oxyacetic acid(34) synthase CmoB [Proteobacteria bacterium]|nr:tRNA 5-methoxyuridine(34)/uridine 5-oxyacetic acid(34) synthase CmoB [Pseudomonadota bacterium]MBU1387324.1 tRNA 5-methoxyuridine(34)/uridine 5-oxyacetic acid(34) synthase CmoB [Pseudomonadota bacterium]MBU1544306.1 tRNA 5-methoxyuridine(34)/uridine 5-oxyacetic acid(34) synthase CmoB [Pseudomonadota bacterium]MBU2480950.1 tRNA 5-methoxyuridine(34)/uridine 5-oxyacetic acid(34) synthase CmoB [Pseudomonadota bacterium]